METPVYNFLSSIHSKRQPQLVHSNASGTCCTAMIHPYVGPPLTIAKLVYNIL